MDLLLLSRCEVFIPSRFSSFSNAASLMGSAQVIYPTDLPTPR